MNRPNDRRSKAPPPKASTDLCDAHEDLLALGQLRVLPPIFQNYGGAEQMSGRVVTLKCFEDNALVRAMLETPGEDRVLVVDGGAAIGARWLAVTSLPLQSAIAGLVW